MKQEPIFAHLSCMAHNLVLTLYRKTKYTFTYSPSIQLVYCGCAWNPTRMFTFVFWKIRSLLVPHATVTMSHAVVNTFVALTMHNAYSVVQKPSWKYCIYPMCHVKPLNYYPTHSSRTAFFFFQKTVRHFKSMSLPACKHFHGKHYG